MGGCGPLAAAATAAAAAGTEAEVLALAAVPAEGSLIMLSPAVGAVRGGEGGEEGRRRLQRRMGGGGWRSGSLLPFASLGSKLSLSHSGRKGGPGAKCAFWFR